MKCKACDKDLMVVDSGFDSEEGTTDVYAVQSVVCTNPNCTLYSGTDLNNPKNSETIKHKVN